MRCTDCHLPCAPGYSVCTEHLAKIHNETYKREIGLKTLKALRVQGYVGIALAASTSIMAASVWLR